MQALVQDVEIKVGQWTGISEFLLWSSQLKACCGFLETCAPNSCAISSDREKDITKRSDLRWDFQDVLAHLLGIV